MKFELETNKGKVSLEKGKLTLADITTMARLLELEGTENKAPKNHGDITLTSEQVEKTINKTHTDSFGRPKRVELKGSENRSEFGLGEVAKIKTTKEQKQVEDEKVDTFITCPECGEKTETKVMPWHSFAECAHCSQKVYVTWDDNDRNIKTGSTKFIRRADLEAMKAEKDVQKSFEEETGLTDTQKRIDKHVVDKDIPSLDTFTIPELRDYADMAKIELKAKMLKNDIIHALIK
ncbi:hypothetical protein [Salinicoccus roseus]|uniref:hypothetical protein n=1 Tax=Salinicoccus roseus TaxID=45670 RepID=UPI0023013CEC|nr:hypothetical protein [Salinicoccus roseus]